MKILFKKTIENLSLIVIILILFLTTFLIGTPGNKENVFIVYIISGVYSIFYFIMKIVKKEKITLNILDVLVFTLLFSAAVPLICSTYVSLSNSILVILKYVVIFSLYVIIKNECIKNSKNFEIIINVLIGSILILCLIGIEQIMGNNLHRFKEEILDYHYINYIYQNRLYSLFGSANAMATIAGAGIFLCIGRFLECKNIKLKIFYIISTLIMVITLIFTYSRTIYVLFAVVFVIYFLILVLKKYKLKKLLNKRTMLIGFSVLVLMIVYLVLALNISKSVKLDNPFRKILYNIESSEEYEISFDIAGMQKDDEILVELIERNDYYDIVNTVTFTIKGVDEEKCVNLHTADTTKVIHLTISCKKAENKENIVIENAYVNDKKFVLENLLIPTSMVDRISSISFKNSSLNERFIFIEDVFKLIKENPLLGYGGKAWETTQFGVQQFNYSSNEVHCYPLQVFLENGIIGILAYIGVLIFILRLLYRELKKEKYNITIISLIVSLGLIMLHAMLDYDMAIFYILLFVFIILSLISSKQENFKECKKWFYVIGYIFMILASAIVLYCTSVHLAYIKDEKVEYTNDGNIEEKTEQLIMYNKFLPYEKSIKEQLIVTSFNTDEIEKINRKERLENLFVTEKFAMYNVLLSYPYSYIKECLNEDNYSEILNNIFEYTKKTESYYMYDASMQMFRINNLMDIVEFLRNNNEDEYAKLFGEQLKKEILAKEKTLFDYEKTCFDKEYVDYYKEVFDIKKNLIIK